ncbi:hypothetical protein [Marinobacter sp. ELB17]|jgi:hypothetical protein|uniref:hypothetical protein n=1 Tax=Marinobacter sp. ELB17 TaxID=270374 RepID=UPI0000F361C6|nr:hypothetical protein [Marinobacter sp. ELB17]EAZ97661.1 hypothetical protein MELB17_24052 [Marinobacter sp. ELB17]
MSSKQMSFGKFIATGSVAIVAALAVLHFTWAGPQIEQKEKMIALVNSAHAVQIMAIQNYALMPDASASSIDLNRAFPNTNSMNNLLRLSGETGIRIKTEFGESSMGNALALSNYVLTGNGQPQFLELEELRDVISERRERLMDSVPLWPWS